ncbi:hypothetical protein QTP70_003043, partial [Hemibagrus guttatus]
MSSILMLVHLLSLSSQGRKRPGKISARQACDRLVKFIKTGIQGHLYSIGESLQPPVSSQSPSTCCWAKEKMNFIPDQSGPGLTMTAIGLLTYRALGENLGYWGQRSGGGRRVWRQREKRKCDEEMMGKFGVKERNLEGEMVVDFAKRMDMAVVNSYFQKREEHRVTYKSGGEDSFELHSVDLELEAVEKQIRDLQVKQTQLRQRKAALESSRTDAHLSQVNSRRETITPTTSTPCASLPRPSARTRPAQVSFTPAPGYHAAWMQQQRKKRAKPRARTSPPPPPPVFEIPTQNRFTPLREMACDAVIIGDSIVRHVRATAAKGKVHTRCLPGARVLDVSAQVPAILKKNIGAVVLHAGTNDIRLRQTEILKKDFRSLVELVRTTSSTTRIIVSGPLPTFQRGIERARSRGQQSKEGYLDFPLPRHFLQLFRRDPEAFP